MAKKLLNSATCATPISHMIYEDYKTIAHQWMLKILVDMGAHKPLLQEWRCDDEEVLVELGLPDFIEAGKFNRAAARSAIFDLRKEVAAQTLEIPSTTTLAKNIRWLGKSIGLSHIEQDILHLRVIASRHIGLRGCLNQMKSKLDLMNTSRLIARLLDLNEDSVESVFSPAGRLRRTGLMNVYPGFSGFYGKFGLLTGIADTLLSKQRNPYDLFLGNFVVASQPKLQELDYPHLDADIRLLTGYLQDCLNNAREGVNILIHGSPGSGKTEFVRMLAQKIGHPLFEIATESRDGEPVRKGERFRSYSLSQHILANNRQRPLILFDEIEDVFRNGLDDGERDKTLTRQGIKAWINKLLEGNQVPAFWLSNDIQCMDQAFLRRFDYVIEINTPPRSVRRRILNQYLADVPVSESWKSTMAEHEQLNPAVVERAAKVVKIAKSIHPEKALERALGNTLEALGLPRSPRSTVQCVTNYRLDILNTDCNVKQVCEGLQEHEEGRLCLYGPPGTGKTAFGRYLADRLNRPLLVRRASDILNPYIGMTERNMAKMFRDAETENAVLLVDEADTFLRDRNGATRSWEVSEVNEMLTQMEAFKGIFIASTNLMESLDAAALRRFDMKVRFDYLKPDQAWKMFQDTAKRLGLCATKQARPALEKLSLLTPGDFANVVRQSRLRKISSAHELIERLIAECLVKPEGKKRAIGF